MHSIPLDITHRDTENGYSAAADQTNISWQAAEDRHLLLPLLGRLWADLSGCWLLRGRWLLLIHINAPGRPEASAGASDKPQLVVLQQARRLSLCVPAASGVSFVRMSHSSANPLLCSLTQETRGSTLQMTFELAARQHAPSLSCCCMAGSLAFARAGRARSLRRVGCKVAPAAKRRANGVAFPADNRASDVLRRLLEVLPCGLRRLWDGGPPPVTLAQSPARQYLAEKMSISQPALCYYYPFFTGLMHLLGA